MKNDPRSCDRNFYNCIKKPEKNSKCVVFTNKHPTVEGFYAKTFSKIPSISGISWECTVLYQLGIYLGKTSAVFLRL